MPEQRLRVSLILPTYNRADLIGETLDAILAQTRPIDEILVMVDGSTDGTEDVLARYGDRISVHVHENMGKAATMNRGLGLATGDLIWICDDDDLLVPTACERLAGVLEAEPQTEFVAGQHKVFHVDPASGEKVFAKYLNWHPGGPGTIFPNMLDDCFILQPALLSRRLCYDRVGGFDTAFIRSQDYEMNLRIARHCRGRLVDEVVYLYRKHEGPRGPSSAPIAASEIMAKWKIYNRKLFGALVPDLADEEMLPDGALDGLTGEARERLLLIRRGGVYGRQGMWPEALDLICAAAARGAPTLSPAEAELLCRPLDSPFGFDDLVHDGLARGKIGQLIRTEPVGRQMWKTMRRHTRWRLKRATLQGELSKAVTYGRFLAFPA
ncbi:glycosyltransferase family 2 protein [Pseudoroseicyclus tamaricis]|uniref:Glycosyltransferase n=1 Tax=Pseudoroseicyclus tamaricis TaxID=2705421 RepID=A0A6B2JYH3_9RHOB|nr:glycosyltransferase [Pseudoroseicyclus tamaricis]NDV01354.1 glycosyltransferase [Pseudoroseicyclus tamaricis]